MLSGDAAGYILVALVAFALGVSFTVFCVLLKKRRSEKERDDDGNN